MSTSTLFCSDVNYFVTVQDVPDCEIVTQTAFQAVALVDSRVEDLPALLASLNPDIAAYILHPEEDSIEQINAVLQQGHIHSLHLFGHGAPGIMQLGREDLSAATVAASAAMVSQWQVQEILLYGCCVGQGLDLLKQLHELTGAGVAAASTPLGNGSWELDVRLGQVEALSAIQSEYGHTLPVELVQNIKPGIGSSSPAGFTVFNNALYFQANDGINGDELWRIDSTGTPSLVQNINPGSSSSSPFSSNPDGFTVFNNALYFRATDNINGTELWRVDSTGTPSLVQINPGNGGSNPAGFTVFSNTLYFQADDGTNGDELWRIDSTGTPSLVQNINPDGGGSRPSGFTAFNNALYFQATDNINGTELWRVDSTGTPSLVQNINPGGGGSHPSGFTAFNNALYFSANDGTNGDELWRVKGSSRHTAKKVQHEAATLSL